MPKVHGFTDANGVTHLPGEIVDLGSSYDGETWLERVESASQIIEQSLSKDVPAKNEDFTLKDESSKDENKIEPKREKNIRLKRSSKMA